MKLDSVRELKASLNESVILPMSTSPAVRSSLGVPAQPSRNVGDVPPTMALGATYRGKGDFALAVRIQKRGLEFSPQLRAIEKKAKGEVDVRYVGRVVKRAPTAQQKRVRPLKLGVSIGHFKITAGTLGAFARDRSTGALLMLSNNHVLAVENRGKKGDAILQPGHFDGGREPDDRVGALERYARLVTTRANLVDAAVATVDAGIGHDARTLAGLGKLAGVGDPLLDDAAMVGKVGRTTGTTRGRVVTIELDNLHVVYDKGALRFDGQIEIEGDGDAPFSDGGDSGSLIVDDSRRAVALLFAGSELGGANHRGLTYANPIDAVLSAMKVELLYD